MQTIKFILLYIYQIGAKLKMNRNAFIGNITTIIKIIVCILAPSVAVWLGTDENTAIALMIAIVGAGFSLVDAKFQNTFFSDSSDDVGVVLND